MSEQFIVRSTLCIVGFILDERVVPTNGLNYDVAIIEKAEDGCLFLQSKDLDFNAIKLG